MIVSADKFVGLCMVDGGMVGGLTVPVTMVHSVGVKSGHGVISGPLIHVSEALPHLIANHTPPAPPLEVHPRDAHPCPPTLAMLLGEIVGPGG